MSSEICFIFPFPFQSLGDFSQRKGYPAVVVAKPINAFFMEALEVKIQKLERKGILPKEK